MEKIVVKKISPEEKEKWKVNEWPIWEKEVSEFPWTYSQTEECVLLEGRVTVTLPEGGTVVFGAGDFVQFPKGLSCKWKIHEPVRKHYRFVAD